MLTIREHFFLVKVHFNKAYVYFKVSFNLNFSYSFFSHFSVLDRNVSVAQQCLRVVSVASCLVVREGRINKSQ